MYAKVKYSKENGGGGQLYLSWDEDFPVSLIDFLE